VSVPHETLIAPPSVEPPTRPAAAGLDELAPADVAATFCATLADEWVRNGVSDIVVSPGSRSTPLAIALASDPRLEIHVHHDERSAGFLGLGLGLASGNPAVVVTTSGTAAVELHPAVVEAHMAGVPLIICTADRPPELLDVGAPQTIDQTHLYGRSVRWFCEPGVPTAAASRSWRSLASRAVAEANGTPPGPVHLNLAFREPLVGERGQLPPGRPAGGPWHRSRPTPALQPDDLSRLGNLFGVERGIIVAGADSGDPDALHALAALLGWPVLADPRSGAQVTDIEGATVVAASDALLRSERFAASERPEVVLRLGLPPTSKVLGQWLASSEATQVSIHPDGAWLDPDRTAGLVVAAAPTEVCRLGAGIVAGDPRWSGEWAVTWKAAEAAAQRTIDQVLADHDEITEPAIARTLMAVTPPDSLVVVSSSMPIRDVEWYGTPRRDVRVLSNRGANGIDGVVSTAVGVALNYVATCCLVGDIAFLHDTNALWGLADREVDLTVVVVDNDGGGIFSFLPQRALLGADRFEQLFGTPHGVDVGAVAEAHGLPVHRPEKAADIGPAIVEAMTAGGARVVHVRTDRDANVAVHRELNAAIAAALPH
jgi:2-succinyl-5-enolpyruvyl-6-hydroxy-3-cyclohexene-1-carboxylate synthase